MLLTGKVLVPVFYTLDSSFGITGTGIASFLTFNLLIEKKYIYITKMEKS
jgi:hypothetical protein